MNFLFRIFRRDKNHIVYRIPKSVISDTVKVLQDYASLGLSHEGLVYWGGTVNDKQIHVSAVFAPKADSTEGSVSTSHASNFIFVKELNTRNLVQVAQVHSHPGTFVEHSEGDDMWAPFKAEGLVSIVVPNYGKTGMLPLHKCGVHLYKNNSFHRLSNKQIRKQFEIVKSPTEFVEMRE